MKIRKKSKGFTLIELMACVAILGILTAALGFFFDGTLKVYANENANTTIQLDARRALTSITDDVRNAPASSVNVDSNDGSILYFKNKNGKNQMKYSRNASTNTLVRSNITNSLNENLISNILDVQFKEKCSQPDGTDILVIYIEAKMKNSSVVYDVSSSIKLPQSVSIKIPTNSMNLNLLEKNVLNLINPDFDFVLNNVTINTSPPQDGIKNNMFFQCKTFDATNNVSGDNFHGDLIVKANTMNWGDTNCMTIAGGSTGIFDVVNFKGTPNALNSTNYENDNYTVSDKGSASPWNKNSTYPKSGEWNEVFNSGDRSGIANTTVNIIKDNIDFSSSPIKDSIHYYAGKNNEIDLQASGDYLLNRYDGKSNRLRKNDTNGDYEYIICHGPLKISSSDSNSSFKFRGLIYCDDVVTFDHIAPAFKGILISRGIASNLDVNQHENWTDMQFDNNNGDLSKINDLLNNATKNN